MEKVWDIIKNIGIGIAKFYKANPRWLFFTAGVLVGWLFL